MKTKTIPFTIEAWKAGGKPVTADGREVKHLTNFETLGAFTLAGAVEGILFTWKINGYYCVKDTIDNSNLMLEVEDTEKELYLVVISTPLAYTPYNVYVSDNIEDAVKQANYLTHLKLPPCNS